MMLSASHCSERADGHAGRDKRHHVLFVGYQAKGTPGHEIQTYGPKDGYVDLDDERFDIHANITSIDGYSAHADQKGLVEFVTGMQQRPTEIRIVHGEARAKQALKAALESVAAEKMVFNL